MTADVVEGMSWAPAKAAAPPIKARREKALFLSIKFLLKKALTFSIQ
jgi:hypothetical protein